MFLLDCPQCGGYTLADDGADRAICQWCHLWVGAVERHAVRDPKQVREFMLNDLRPIADLMRTFGIGQTVIAVAYFVFFLGCAGLLNHFNGQMNDVMLIAVGIVLLIGGVFIIAGSVAVRKGQGRLYAMVGAIFTLTSPLILGAPIGAWALWKLTQPGVRTVFEGSPPSAS